MACSQWTSMCPFWPSENVHEYIWSCWTACFHVTHPPRFGATLLSGASELYHQWGQASQKPSMPAHPCTSETSATHQTQTLEGSSHKQTHRTSVRLEMGSGVDVRCCTAPIQVPRTPPVPRSLTSLDLTNRITHNNTSKMVLTLVPRQHSLLLKHPNSCKSIFCTHFRD